MDYAYVKPMRGLLVTLFLTGCATASLPDYAGNHPANPGATEAPASEPSQTLASYWEQANASDSDEPEADVGSQRMEHSQHRPAATMAATEHDSDQGSDHAHAVSTAGKPGTAGKVAREIKVTAGDTMRYDPSSIQVNPDETIRFIVTNTGKLAHEFVLGDAKEQREHAVMMQKMPGRVHKDANTVTVEPGATKTLIWQFGEAGEVEFACHVPGHYEAGMVGRVLVGVVKPQATQNIHGNRGTNHGNNHHEYDH
ncbi:MAG: cupredoxin domain-containing protein [Burkholderiales bacterium]